MAVDMDERRIVFHVRFVLEFAPQPSLCTADCEGAGSIAFDVGALRPGTYSVWMGSTHWGYISLPWDPGTPNVCTPPGPTLPPPATPLPTPTLGGYPR